MRQQWKIAAAALFAVMVIGVVVACGVWGDGKWGPDRGDVVTRSVAADGTETIVVREGRGGFFPFGLFFLPLAIVFWVFVFRVIFGGRGRWGGPGNGPSGSPPWLDEWHRRKHGDGPQPPAASPAS